MYRRRFHAQLQQSVVTASRESASMLRDGIPAVGTPIHYIGVTAYTSYVRASASCMDIVLRSCPAPQLSE